MAHIIEQEGYPDIKVDNSAEKYICFGQKYSGSSDVIIIYRETLPELIAHLQTLVKERV